MPMSLVCILFFAACTLSGESLPSSSATKDNVYDFIVVGAGTSGCVLTARLCRRLPHARILLLERGAPRTSEQELTLRAARTLLISWADPNVAETIPTGPELALNNRTTFGITGRTLGGSSSINGGQFTYPIRGTIPTWGIVGLNDRRARKLLRRVTEKLGVAIPPQRLLPRYLTPYMRAAARAGFRTSNTPYDGESERAVWLNRLSYDPRGRRVDSFTGYLQPELQSACAQSVSLVLNATVSKVLLRKVNGTTEGGIYRAHGVRYKTKGVIKAAYAAKEVIIAAGPYGSPQLLQLSGIGPTGVLRRAGVRQSVLLPVGMFAQSRASIAVIGSHTRPVQRANREAVLQSQAALKQFLAGRGGVLAVAPGGLNGRIGKLGYLVATTMAVLDAPMLASACVSNSAAKTFATVQIRSDDVRDAPGVVTNVLTGPGEMRRAVACVRGVLRMHDEMSSSLGFVSEPNANLTAANRADDTFMTQFVQNTTTNGIHFVGGCAVGKVVSGNLNVLGVRSLRVIDASSIPQMPISAGPASSVYIIAEHLADKIAKKYKVLS